MRHNPQKSGRTIKREIAAEKFNTNTAAIETADSPLSQFLAEHPHEREAHELRMAEVREISQSLADKIQPSLQGIIDRAEEVRRIGIVLTEEASALPGGKFSRDFYEQMKHELVDRRGQSISFALCEWAIRVAHENTAPINNLLTALKYKQPLLMATGDPDFQLESGRPPQHALQPADPRAMLNKLCDVAALKSARENFTKKYFVDDKWVDGAIDVMAGQLKPFFDEAQSFREELGI